MRAGPKGARWRLLLENKTEKKRVSPKGSQKGRKQGGSRGLMLFYQIIIQINGTAKGMIETRYELGKLKSS